MTLLNNYVFFVFLLSKLLATIDNMTENYKTMLEKYPLFKWLGHAWNMWPVIYSVCFAWKWYLISIHLSIVHLVKNSNTLLNEALWSWCHDSFVVIYHRLHTATKSSWGRDQLIKEQWTVVLYSRLNIWLCLNLLRIRLSQFPWDGTVSAPILLAYISIGYCTIWLWL